MKISILQENLTKGLNLVSRCVAAKASLPILGNILLATDKGRLKLSATNLEMGINLWLGAKIEEEGGLAVPARIFTELVSSLPPEKIEIKTEKTSLLLSSPTSQANLIGLSPAEFPSLPSFSGSGKPLLVFEKEKLVKALPQVVFAAAADEARPVLTGVLLQKEKEKISWVATDGYRLSLKNIIVEEDGLGERLLIPAKALGEILRLVQEKDEEGKIRMALTAEKTQVVFALPEIEFSSRLLEGEFPDFEKIVPQSFSTRVEFDKEEFLRAVRLASIFAREQANIVKLKIDPSADGGRLIVSAESPQIGRNESEISLKAEGEKLEIAFNCRFLLDFLTSCPAEEIIFEANSPLSPGVFKIKGDDSFLHLIMPVRVQT